jgi:hypothetical protein
MTVSFMAPHHNGHKYKNVRSFNIATIRIDLSRIDCLLFTFSTNLQLQSITEYANENSLGKLLKMPRQFGEECFKTSITFCNFFPRKVMFFGTYKI